MKYKKKPVIIDAIQWTGSNTEEILLFCNGNATIELGASKTVYLVITTLEDGENMVKHAASKMDYIIKGIKGEFYACKPDIFNLTYEVVDETCNS